MRFSSPRTGARAFVSALLWQLVSPPFLPQFCSTRAELVIIHTMAFCRTVIRFPELSAWTCQPFCCQRTIPLILSGCFEFLEASGCLSRRFPLFSFQFRQNIQKIKNPASSAGHSCLNQATSRVARLVLACARKKPHLGSTSGFDPTVTAYWFVPPCNGDPGRFAAPRTICNYTSFHVAVNP